MTFDENVENKALNEFESLNLDIPSNKDIVKNFHVSIIKEKMLKNEPLDEDAEAEKLLKDLQTDNHKNSMDETDENIQ